MTPPVLGQPCDGDRCTEPATTVGAIDVPGRRIEVLLCERHQSRLAAGEALGIRADRGPRGDWGPTVVQFRN